MSGTRDLVIRPLAASDQRWVRNRLVRDWSSTSVARRGELIDATGLQGHVALRGGRRAGMALVDVRGDELEIVVLSSSRPRQGVGRALVARCVDEAVERRCRRVWLVTTNNNITAIAFYQHVGMDLCAFRRYAVRAARELKPTLSLRDSAGLPIDHELEFEILLPR